MVRGLYIHIPFCSYKCPYCDFTSLVKPDISYGEYIDLIIREAELYRDISTDLETVYLGGGTPTLLAPEEIEKLLDGLSRMFDLSKVKEITVECNPETYRYAEFKKLREIGVNRLSIGVQSFIEKGLRVLGRKHSAQDSLIAFEDARSAGFENINIDLIYAYPGQKPDDVEIELEMIEEIKPEHVSAYMLTPYHNTPLGLQIMNEDINIPDEDTLTTIYERLWKGLRSLGYNRYEISNWAFRGYECIHNLIYWKIKEFLGFGVSAWGFLKNIRYGNKKNLKTYVKSVAEGKKPVESRIYLSEKDLFEEFIMLRLRLKEGLPKKYKFLIPEHLESFFEETENGMGIKEEYMLLSNEIITDVLLYNSDRKSLEVRNG